ncbi:DNA-binding MarR family transcriptional regulator [Pseudarthrobacter defluvii]|uniref:MarR family transcriptional regulator n=1 Tax=Pseudarthrobacter defluvii TaxID=410837 RepID=UPI0027884DA3|nr:MarR family transcriptional regulator [Pseudarthrobacter defluvii]MDQ0768013.1 DNA-binding MarR family transcriptional regulator [Pseudarthrobacter defluvii]
MGTVAAAGHSQALEHTLTASRALLGLVARSLAGVSDAVTLPQFRVLVLLASRGPARMGDLARLLGVHQSSFSRTAERLETAGLLLREQSPGSRREVMVSATAQGLRIVEDVTQARRREIAQVLAGLSPAEQDKVAAGFELFALAAGEPSAAETLLLGI